MIKKFTIFFTFSILIIGFTLTIALTPDDSLPTNKLNSLVLEDLSNSNFENNDLSGIDFSGKNLSNSNFEKSIIFGSNFRLTNLENANFKDANLSGADLAESNFF